MVPDHVLYFTKKPDRVFWLHTQSEGYCLLATMVNSPGIFSFVHAGCQLVYLIVSPKTHTHYIPTPFYFEYYNLSSLNIPHRSIRFSDYTTSTSYLPQNIGHSNRHTPHFLSSQRFFYFVFLPFQIILLFIQTIALFAEFFHALQLRRQSGSIFLYSLVRLWIILLFSFISPRFPIDSFLRHVSSFHSRISHVYY